MKPAVVDRSVTSVCAARPGEACELVSLGAFRDQSGLVGAVSVDRCRYCGVGISRPPVEDVSFLYADRTSTDFQPNTTTGLSKWIKRVAYTAQANRMIAQSGFKGGRIIDFACGSGLFSACMAHASGAEMIASDFHDEPPENLDSAQYRPLSKMADLDGSADLVLAMHVVEHDNNPVQLVERIARLAKPGATIVIEVPNIDCPWNRIFGRFWDAWYLPYHRVHFSRASLRGTVTAAGLKVEREIDVTVPAMGRSIANLVGRQNSTAFIILSAILQPLQWAVEAAVGQPSALRLVLRKPA